MHRVVRPFPYAGNGYTLELLNAGVERDFGSATAGLAAEGWIEPVGATVPADEPMEMAIEKPRRGRPRK